MNVESQHAMTFKRYRERLLLASRTVGRAVLFAALLGAPSSLIAQTAKRLAGSVRDSAGIAVSGARVEVVESGARAFTADDGTFSITVPDSGARTIRVTRLGFRPHDVALASGPDGAAALSITLIRAPLPLGAVVISPGYFGMLAQTTGSTESLTREQILTRPQLGEDLFRSINRMPGLSSADFGAGFHVRGAEIDQLLVSLDGLQLHEPFHMKDFDNALSILDVQSVGGIELTTSGFTAEQGGKLGSVLLISSTEPRTDRVRTAIGASVTNLRLQSQGGFASGRGGWLVSGRRGYLDLALKLAGRADSISPTYNDIFAKLSFELDARNRLTAHLLRANDATQYAEGSGAIDSKYGSNYGWLTWTADPGAALHGSTVLSTGSLSWRRAGNVKEQTPTRSTVTDSRAFSFTGLRSEWSLSAANAFALKWGGEWRTERASYDYHGVRSKYRLQNHARVIDLRTIDAKLAPSGSQLSAWLAPRWKPVSWLVAEVGARYDNSSWTGDRDFSPRANVMIALGAKTALRVAAGKYAQAQELWGLQVQDGVQNFGKSDLAEHHVIGLEHHPAAHSTIRIEAYERVTTRERPRYITLRANTEVFPELMIDRLLLDATSGMARGVELSVRVTPAEGLEWSASFTRARVTDNVAGTAVPRTYDQQETAYLDASYRPPGGDWRFSIAWQGHTGWPESPVKVQTDTLLPSRSPAVLLSFGPVTALGQSRLPRYQRADIRVTRDVQTSHGRVTFFADLFNVFDNVNPSGYDYSARLLNNVLTISKTARAQLGRLPSAGISWEF